MDIIVFLSCMEWEGMMEMKRGFSFYVIFYFETL